MTEDSRLRLIHDWLEQIWPGHLSVLLPVSGDASFRRYFRCLDPNGRSLIVMDAPPELEDCVPFVQVEKDWLEKGIPVPKIYQVDLDQGLMLLEDFGKQTLYAALQAGEPHEAYYEEALVLLEHIQRDTTLAILPPYDESRFLDEMALFKDWLIEKHLGMTLPEDLWRDCTRSLVDNALAQPQVSVHRDFHSKNMMVRPDGGLGLIDFQDAMQGPVSYDLVSLLRDCYVSLPQQTVCAMRDRFASALGYSAREFGRWFDLMGMQRHLKASGIFARLFIRDGKPSYLNDIPLTLRYLVDVSRQYVECQELGQWIESSVIPAYERSQQQEHSS